MQEKESMARKVAEIRVRMAEAALESGRQPGDISLCAACKTQPPEVVAACAATGIDLFGENRVQELKRNLELGVYGDKPVHFIGHLQTNKVKDVVGKVRVIESVDSPRLLEAIAKQACKLGIVQDIFVEINIGREEGKSGIFSDELDAFLDMCGGTEGIFVRGMMAVPPKTEDLSLSRQYFSSLYDLFIDSKAKKYDNVIMDFLSMGMSRDYTEAIRMGASIVRVGTGIFGPRQYN